MQAKIHDILLHDWSSPAPARWLEPDLVILDDMAGMEALRLIADGGRPSPSVRYPERFRVLSRIDLESALPDRLQVDEVLRAFAEDTGIALIRNTDLCEGGCDLAIGDHPAPYSLLATSFSPAAEIGGTGSLHVRANALDLAHALMRGSIWFRRPPILPVRLFGRLHDSVTLHDVAIRIRAGIIPESLLLVDVSDCALRHDHSATITLAALLQDSKAAGVICIKDDLFDDERVRDRVPYATVFDLESMQSLVASDPSAPALASDVGDLKLDRAYIGSCTTGRIDDLRLAARFLVGRRVSVPTIIAPASVRDAELLEVERLDPDDPAGPTLMKVFRDAGCDIGLPGCSACVNAIASLMDESAGSNGRSKRQTMRIIATAAAGVSAREVAEIYTASPITAARSAVAGRIVGVDA